VGPQGKGKVVSVQNETSLRAGDQLKVFFEPRSDLHFYLLHISSQGELTPLFPAEAQPSKVAAGTQVFIPAGNNWFELDAHPGQEKFFLIATAERLDRLEELCTRHTALKDKADVQSSTDAILDEIKRLRQKHRQLSAPAENPSASEEACAVRRRRVPRSFRHHPLAAESRHPVSHQDLFH
jgi:hypothetical protein